MGINKDFLALKAGSPGQIHRHNLPIFAISASGHIANIPLGAHIQRVDLLADIIVSIGKYHSRLQTLRRRVIHALPHHELQTLLPPVQLDLRAEAAGIRDRPDILR